MRYFRQILVIAGVMASGLTQAQTNSYNFHHLTVKDGLNDGIGRCVGQDRYGYIWIGSVGALNRFDGKNVKRFTNVPGDSTSAYATQPRCVYSDSSGRFWVGFENGLAEFEFQHETFKKISYFEELYIYKIVGFADSLLYVASSKGLVRYNKLTNEAFYYRTSTNNKHTGLIDNTVTDMEWRDGKLYSATPKGLVILDQSSDSATQVHTAGLEGIRYRYLTIDAKGNVWVGTHDENKLIKLFPGFKQFKTYAQYFTSDMYTQQLNMKGVMVDSHNKLWVITGIDGLLEYIPSSDAFVKHLHHPNLPSSPMGNNYRSIFEDADGFIWLGGDYRGLDYFDPKQHLFQTIFPFADSLDVRQRNVGRACTVDKDGNFWMGTHDGVSRFNPQTHQYSTWQNEINGKRVIYNNLVRSMECDDDNNIWIGTASGVNRFNNRTKQMEFIAETSLPLWFYNSINKDRSGNIWFSTNDTSCLYWYTKADGQFHNVADHPVLKQYKGMTPLSYVMEDSKHRYWISYSRMGVVMYEPAKGTTKAYRAPADESPGIIGDQIIDIKEDKKGIIWISTFNGITGINVEANTFQSFNSNNGLPGNMVSSLVVDRLDRLWISATGGLTMLNADRTQLTVFDEGDGLPSIEFPEHAGFIGTDGFVMLPSNNGFIRFNPSLFQKEKYTLKYYLASYSLFNGKEIAIPEGEENIARHFKADENSFTFNLVALNFRNPTQTWFAYKLDGFEKNWHYTQDAKAVYTNVSAGKYTFLFKATHNNSHWDEADTKLMKVTVDAYYFKTIWFRAMLVVIFLLLVLYFYRFRLEKHKQIINLESKATSLEREKTLIQYESLKQQLNPHFLFNSLTSLRSLIKTDSKTASWFLDGLSKVYRYILKSGDQELVNLKSELEFVKTFVELQQVRFGKGLQVDIQQQDEYFNQLIAPAVLQNLVENALKHNTASIEKPLFIEVFCADNYIVVRNTLQRYRYVETSNKSGLASLRNLYGFYTDKEILVEENEHYFSVKIPLL